MASIQFCPKCGKMLKVKEAGGKKLGICKCGYEKEDLEIFFAEKPIKEVKRAKGVAYEKNEFATFPHICKKCGHTRAEIIDVGAPYSDESNVYLFVCGKCGYVERQADGSGNK